MKLAPLADMWPQYPVGPKDAVATLVGGNCGGAQACYFNSVLTNAGVNPSTNATLTVYLRLGTPCRDRFVSSGTLALLLKAGNQ